MLGRVSWSRPADAVGPPPQADTGPRAPDAFGLFKFIQQLAIGAIPKLAE